MAAAAAATSRAEQARTPESLETHPVVLLCLPRGQIEDDLGFSPATNGELIYRIYIYTMNMRWKCYKFQIGPLHSSDQPKQRIGMFGRVLSENNEDVVLCV